MDHSTSKRYYGTKAKSTHWCHTTFSPKQLRILTDVFGKTMYPHWDTMAELTSATQLDESVIKSWFKIQCIKRRKQLLQCQPSWHKKHKTKPFQWKRRRLLYHNFYKHLSQEPQHCECCGHEPPKTLLTSNLDGMHPGILILMVSFSWSGCLWSSLGLQSLSHRQPYALPGEDHLSSLDQ